MRFQIVRSIDSGGNTDHFASYIPEGAELIEDKDEKNDKVVAIIEIGKDFLIYASGASMHAMQALAEMDPDSEESFAKALEELVHEAFHAGMKYKSPSP